MSLLLQSALRLAYMRNATASIAAILYLTFVIPALASSNVNTEEAFSLGFGLFLAILTIVLSICGAVKLARKKIATPGFTSYFAWVVAAFAVGGFFMGGLIKLTETMGGNSATGESLFCLAFALLALWIEQGIWRCVKLNAMETATATPPAK